MRNVLSGMRMMRTVVGDGGDENCSEWNASDKNCRKNMRVMSTMIRGWG